MHLLSINIGKTQPIKTKSGMTGIYKQPVLNPVHISSNGLMGDAICDTENHGGVDQAVYIYGEPDYAHWAKVFGREMLPGTFGENLTMSDLESADFNVGDELHVGAVTLQVTCPRIPCVTLATRMGDPGFVKLFREVERPGLYCRVLQAGGLFHHLWLFQQRSHSLLCSRWNRKNHPNSDECIISHFIHG